MLPFVLKMNAATTQATASVVGIPPLKGEMSANKADEWDVVPNVRRNSEELSPNFAAPHSRALPINIYYD